jgi:hypothetical protein
VIEKALILNGDDGLDEVGRHLRERHFDPLLFEDGEDGPILRIEDRRRLGHVADAAQRRAIRKTGGQVVGGPRDPTGGKKAGNRQRPDRGHQRPRTISKGALNQQGECSKELAKATMHGRPEPNETQEVGRSSAQP